MNMLKITKQMGGKMKGFWSINTSPLDNPFCVAMAKTNAVCAKCYSQRLEKMYGSVECIGHGTGKVKAWVDNGVILSGRLLKDNEIPLYPKRGLMRFSSHGELFNKTHLHNLIAITEANPQAYHALWTKRLDLTRSGVKRLENLQYIYSVPELNKENTPIPKGFDKVFAVFDKKYAKKENVQINCGGKKCMDCLICYAPYKEARINELLK